VHKSWTSTLTNHTYQHGRFYQNPPKTSRVNFCGHTLNTQNRQLTDLITHVVVTSVRHIVKSKHKSSMHMEYHMQSVNAMFRNFAIHLQDLSYPYADSYFLRLWPHMSPFKLYAPKTVGAVGS